MAHGYLSANDLRGKSGIEKSLERYLEDKFNDLKKKIRDGFRRTDQKVEQVAVRDLGRNMMPNMLPQGQQGLLSGSNPRQLGGATPSLLSGSKYAEIASAPATKGLLSAEKPIDVEVMGMNPVMGQNSIASLPSSDYAGTRGAIDTSFVDLGSQRDLPGSGDNFFPTSMDVGGGGGGTDQIVQSIDRLTMVTTMLVQATKEQTQQQGMIASSQMQQSEKLARQAKASSEEASLEQGADLSGNSAYAMLGAAGAGGGRAGFGGGGGGGPGMGLGGKVMAKNMLKGATKRGAARTGTRLGAALGGKMLGGFGARMGAKLGSKSIGKVAGKGIAKSLGKKIPLVGLGLGAVFAAQRAMKGDFVGAGLELASGAASTVPGIGTAGSVGIDAALMARDMMKPMAEGGIVNAPTNALIGEAGKEGVFPLSGSEGKKTFLKFGEGILDAQIRGKAKFIKLQAEGLAEFYLKKPWWGKLLEGLVAIFRKIPGIGRLFGGNGENGDRQWWNPLTWGNNGDDDGVTPKSTMLPAKGDAVKGSYDSFLGGRPAFTSGFGLRNTGLPDASTDHGGIDIGVDPGAEVKAIESGKVVQIHKDFGGHGDGLVVEHADGSQNVYGHIESSVGIGDEVKAGDKVGLIKYWPDPNYSAGRQHLHLERIESGTRVDPQTYLDNLMAADEKEVKADVEKIKKNPQVEAVTSLMEGKRKGKRTIEGVGTVERRNVRGSKTATYYRDDAGKTISKEEFMSKLRAAQADPSSALNKASTEVSANDRASNAGGGNTEIALTTSGDTGSSVSSSPDPGASISDVLPVALRSIQLATAT